MIKRIEDGPGPALPGVEVLRLILPNRSAESYFAGSATMSDTLGRLPDDYDIHHPSASVLECAMALDRQTVESGGGRCRVYEETAEEVKGLIEIDGVEIKLDWVIDDQPRILGPVPDPEWVYRLHPFDVSVHKIIQAARCGAPKDLKDLLRIHDELYPLARLANAAPLRDTNADPCDILGALAEWWRRRRHDDRDLRKLFPKANSIVAAARLRCSGKPRPVPLRLPKISIPPNEPCDTDTRASLPSETWGPPKVKDSTTRSFGQRSTSGRCEAGPSRINSGHGRP